VTDLTADGFAPHVGTTFGVPAPDAQLELVDVERGPTSEPTGRPFTVTFTSQTSFGQGTYEVEHPEMGRFAVFLVPRQPLADGLHRYDAVFN
jgi:hypothetical protein